MSLLSTLQAASPPDRASLQQSPQAMQQYETVPLDELSNPRGSLQRPDGPPSSERRAEASEALRKIHAQSSAETSGLGDSLQRMHALSSTETSGYGGEAGGPSPTGQLSPYASAEAVERRVPDRSVWAVEALPAARESAAITSRGHHRGHMQKIHSLDRDYYHGPSASFGHGEGMDGWRERQGTWGGDRRQHATSHSSQYARRDPPGSSPPSDQDNAQRDAPPRRSPTGGLHRSNTSSEGRFLGRSTAQQSAWLKWSHDRRASFRRRVEGIERRQSELDRVRVSSPVRKARQESVRFVSPHLETQHLANVVDEAVFGHPAFPFEIPPTAAAAGAGAARKASGGSQGAGGKGGERLTVGQWNALIEYWEHDLFVGTRFVGLLLGVVAVLVGLVAISTSHWSRLRDHPAFGSSHSGLWIVCSTALNNCTSVDFDKWHVAIIGLLLFSVAFDLMAIALSLCGVWTSALPKKIYYYHSAGESHLLCAIGGVIALVMYPLATPYIDIRQVTLQSFGYSYLLSVAASACQCCAAFCMCLDDLIHGLASCCCGTKRSQVTSDKKPDKLARRL